MTSILFALAARYVACTSRIFFEIGNETCTWDHPADSTARPGATKVSHNTTSPNDVIRPSDFNVNNADKSYTRPKKRQSRNSHLHAHLSPVAFATTEPQVVVVDLEYGIHADKLILSVREAVLRRWEETSIIRQWRRKQQYRLGSTNNVEGEQGCVVADENIGNDCKIHDETLERNEDANQGVEENRNVDDDGDVFNNAMNEQHQIELAIASCLGRIHIVQPRDFTYLSLVATIESLRQSLDNQKIQRNQQLEILKQHSLHCAASHQQCQSEHAYSTTKKDPPTLILIDSLSTLDASTKMQESLPTASGSKSGSGGSGLSNRNEFYRQLIRLREEHEIVIVGTSKSLPSANRSSNDNVIRSGAKPGRRRGSDTMWDKMVTHRVMLHYVAEGTKEDQDGYDFVAILNGSGAWEGVSVFPYSVTAGGISS